MAKLTLFRSSRRDYATLPLGDPEGPPAGAVGADGESWYDAMLGGGPDVNPELTGSAKFHVYDEMSMTDASVKGMLMYWQLPVRSAVWGLNPRPPVGGGDPDATARAIRDATNAQFGIEQRDDTWLDLSWKELLAQGMGETLKMGACVEEYNWGDLRSWRDADGDEHFLRPLEQIALRPAATISKVNQTRGRVVSVEQDLPGTRAIPGPGSDRGSKLSYMVFERRGRHWDGVSALRAAWGPWTLKKALMIAAGIGWDRFASGLPVVYHPNNAEAEEKAKRIGRSIRQHERAYVHLPSESASTSGGKPESEWFVDLLNGASTLADPSPLLTFFTDQIYETGMMQFARQGFGQTGARATSETQIDPYFLAVQELADYMRRERARQPIRRFVEVNFGAEAADLYTPILTVSKIQARSVTTISTAIAQLEQAGITFTDSGAVNDIRELLGFEQLPEAADAMGITPQQLDAALRGAGLDEATLAQIVDSLPDGIGLTRNTVPKPREGTLTG